MAHSAFIFPSYAASRLTCRLLYLVHVQSTSLGSALLGSVPACLNFFEVCGANATSTTTTTTCATAKPDLLRTSTWGGIGQEKKKDPLAVC